MVISLRFGLALGLLTAGACTSAPQGARLGKSEAALSRRELGPLDPAQGPRWELDPVVTTDLEGFAVVTRLRDRFAFTRLRVQGDGELTTLTSSEGPVRDDLLTDDPSTGTLAFDGSRYLFAYPPNSSITQGRPGWATLVTLNERGEWLSVTTLGIWSVTLTSACSSGGLCLFVGAEYHQTGAVLTKNGVPGETISLPLEVERRALRTIFHDDSFWVFSAHLTFLDDDKRQGKILLTRVGLDGKVLGEPEPVVFFPEEHPFPESLAVAQGKDSVALVFGDSDLVLRGVRLDAQGKAIGAPTVLADAAYAEEREISADVSVELGALGDGFLLSYNDAGKARLLAMNADLTPAAEGPGSFVDRVPGRKFSRPVLASDGQHYLAVSEMGEKAPRPSVYRGLLDAQGKHITKVDLVEPTSVTQENLQVVWNGERYVAAWLDSRDGWDLMQIRLAFISKDGTVERVTSVLPEVRNDGVRPYLEPFKLAATPSSTLLAWAEYDWSNNDNPVYAAVIDAEGNAKRHTLVTGAAGAGVLAASAHGTGYAVVYAVKDANNGVAFVNADGELDGGTSLPYYTNRPDYLVWNGSHYLDVGWASLAQGKVVWGAELHLDGHTSESFSTLDINNNLSGLAFACGSSGCLYGALAHVEAIYAYEAGLNGLAKPNRKFVSRDYVSAPELIWNGSSYLLSALHHVGGDTSSNTAEIKVWELAPDGTTRGEMTITQNNSWARWLHASASDGQGGSLFVYQEKDTNGAEAVLLNGPLSPDTGDAATPPDAGDAGTPPEGPVTVPVPEDAGSDGSAEEPPDAPNTPPEPPPNADAGPAPVASHHRGGSCDVARGSNAYGPICGCLLGLMVWLRRRKTSAH